MSLDLVETTVGLISLIPLALLFLLSSELLPLGALSLPSVMVMTSVIYFYIMPVLSLLDGDDGVFGMYLTNLTWAHFAVLLYSLGAAAAFGLQRRYLMENPGLKRNEDRQMRLPSFFILWGLAALGLIFEVETSRLNLFGSANFEAPGEKILDFAFLQETYNLLIPITVVLLVRDRFRWRSLLVLLAVAYVCLQVGFRFRVIILMAGVATAFALTRNIKPRASYAVIGVSLAVVAANVIGSLRRYGQGLDLTRLDTLQASDLTSFKGELGIVYTLAWTADNPLPRPVPFEPWLVALARFVPSFLWADKPNATYLDYFMAGANIDATGAGMAASQHVEMLLQWGWFGPPFLALLYFLMIGYLIHRLNFLGYEARIAGCSLAPAFFGFYMQSRGYFFQIFADSLFVFGPLFLMHLGPRRSVNAARAPLSA